MSKRPNILFLMADQLRSDYLGWHPATVASMPNLERLSRGTVFQTAVTPNPLCTPARVSLLTGKYPHQVGMLNMSGDLSLQHRTYPQALQAAGYRTAAIGKGHWFQTWPWGTPRGQGLDLHNMKPALAPLGFETLEECTGKELLMKNRCDYAVHLEEKGLLEQVRDHIAGCHGSGPRQGRGTTLSDYGEVCAWPFAEEDYYDHWIADRCIRWMGEQTTEKPWLLFASFVSPHPPFDPPPRWMDAISDEEVDQTFRGGAELAPADREKVMCFRRAYLANVRHLDAQIGRVLDTLEQSGQAGNTVVLFCSDHGEFLGDWNRMNKSRPEWVSSEVPLVIFDPRHPQSRVVDSVVEISDLTTTILDLAGLDPVSSLGRAWPAFHNRIPSRSLLPLVHGHTDKIRDYAFSSTLGEWAMIRSREFRYIRWSGHPDGCAREEFFSTNDPNQLHDLAQDPACSAQLGAHREALLQILENTPPAQLSWAEEFLMPPKA